MKPRWRIVWVEWNQDGFYLSPQNYEAETIHLIQVYGHTNTWRRFLKVSPK